MQNKIIEKNSESIHVCLEEQRSDRDDEQNRSNDDDAAGRDVDLATHSRRAMRQTNIVLGAHGIQSDGEGSCESCKRCVISGDNRKYTLTYGCVQPLVAKPPPRAPQVVGESTW